MSFEDFISVIINRHKVMNGHGGKSDPVGNLGLT